MRGFPPIQILILCAAFGLLAIPLLQLTGNSAFAAHRERFEADHHDHDHDHDHHDHDHEGDGPKVVQGSDEHPEGEHVHAAVPALIRLRYAHRPLSVVITQDAKELVKFDKPEDFSESAIEAKIKIGVSHDGNEMEVAATWPPNTPATALTLEIEPDNFETRSETRWATDSQLDEIITFKW